MRDCVLKYMDECTKVSTFLMRAIAIGLMGENYADYFEKRFSNNPTKLFRIFRYPKHVFEDEADEWGKKH